MTVGDISENVFLVVLNTFQSLRKSYSSKSTIILKLHIELYQKITSIVAQRTFLKTINSSNNQYSGLYIA